MLLPILSLQDSGVSNPVILLDEIDKMGRSIEHGDPAYALLDILEPKQCKNFRDVYMDLPYDLSDVTFVITSNDIKRIPDVLRDRLSIINIPAYTKKEKADICKFSIQKMLAESKLTSEQASFSDKGIEEIVEQAADQGARRTIENLKNVFANIKQTLETIGHDKKIVIDKDFVANSLQK